VKELAGIPELGEAMLAAAKLADWDEVRRLDDERHALLSALDTRTLLLGGEPARQILEQALEITHHLLKQAREVRAEHLSELSSVQRSKKGAKAYLSSE
jgi:hypothetical protein